MADQPDQERPDRRQGRPRIPLRVRVWCEDDEVTLYVPVLDASLDGMCVRTGCSFETGRRVRIGVFSPDGDVEATARVAWSRDKRDAPATGLHIEAFVRGRDAFAKMVTRARERSFCIDERSVEERAFDS